MAHGPDSTESKFHRTPCPLRSKRRTVNIAAIRSSLRLRNQTLPYSTETRPPRWLAHRGAEAAQVGTAAFHVKLDTNRSQSFLLAGIPVWRGGYGCPRILPRARKFFSATRFCRIRIPPTLACRRAVRAPSGG